MRLTKRIMLIFILVVCISISGLADNGRIGGVVVAEENQQPLPGANIILVGTLLGAAADLDGGFTIENVPPGDYTLEVLNIGYQSVRQLVTVQGGERIEVRIALPTRVLKSPEIVVTGARRAVRKADSPVTIATISAEDISLRNPTTMEDVLPYESGVQIIDGQINIRGSSGYARGAGTRVSVLVDGFPAISFDNGTIYWEAIPAQDIERVEILKGPGSALYGSSALGGVVNIITKRIPGGTHTRFSLSQGIYSKPSDARRVWTNRPMTLGEYRLTHSRSFGKLKLTAGLAQNNSRGYYQNGWYHRTILESRVEYAPGQNRQLLSRLFYILDRHGSFTQWKSPFQPFHTPAGTQNDAIKTSKLQWSTVYSRIVSPRQSRLLRFHLFQTGFDNELYNNSTTSRARTAQSELQLDLRPNQTHYLTTGIDLKLHQVMADIWGNHHGGDAAVYLQDELNFGTLVKLTGGLRGDLHKIDNFTTESQLNPKLGVTLSALPGLTLRASAGRGFRAPAIAELFIESQQYIFQVKPNPDLQSETSVAAEIGIYWQTYWFDLDLAVFSSHYQHLIEPLLDQSDQKIQFRNITEARISGFEITTNWSWQFIPATGTISYTYLDPRDLSANLPLAYRHNHSLVISQQVNPAVAGWLSFGMDYRYLSKMERVQLYDENAKTGADQRVPIHLVGGFCNLLIKSSLQLNLSVENLLQYYYVIIERNLGPVRLIKLRVDYSF